MLVSGVLVCQVCVGVLVSGVSVCWCVSVCVSVSVCWCVGVLCQVR